MADKTQKFLASLYQQAGRDATANPQMASQGTSDPMQALAALWRAANHNILPGVAQPDINAGLDAVAQQAGNYVGGLTNNPTVGGLVQAGVSLAAPGPKENAVGLAGRMAEGGHEISAGQRMGQFMGRENFSRAGAGYAKEGRNLRAEVDAIRNQVAKESGYGAHATEVSDLVGPKINLEHANDLLKSRDAWQGEVHAMLADSKAAKTPLPRNITTMINERGQVPEEILAKFVESKFGPPSKGIKYGMDEIRARLNWLNGGGDPRNFPVPVAEKAKNMGEAMAQSKKATHPGRNFIAEGLRRNIDETHGQAILDGLVDSGRTVKDVEKDFWGNTFQLLPPETQAKFQRMAEKISGIKVGGVVSVGRNGEEVIAKHPSDLLDLGTSVDHLEGTERGMVALMEEANRRLSGATSSTPKQIGGK